MDLSIVIVSWNVRALLVECLESIFTSQTKSTYDIWVVDNASTDGTVQAVREQYPAIHLIANQHNAGFAAGNNQAIRHSNGRVVLLLNPDTRLHTGALDALVQFLDQTPSAGAAGAYLLNPDGSMQTACFPFPTLAREAWRLFHLDRFRSYGVYHTASWSFTNAHQVDVVQGTCLALRRSALDQVGLLDEAFFMYTEEVDLCYRLHRAGWKNYWVPTSRVVHYGGQSTQQVAQTMFVSLYKTKMQFIRKHYGRLAGHLYRLILLCASVTRLGLSALSWMAPAENRSRQEQVAANYRHLIRVLPGL